MAALVSGTTHIIIVTSVGVLCEGAIGTARVEAVHFMHHASCWVGGGIRLIYKILDDKGATPVYFSLVEASPGPAYPIHNPQ